MWLRCSAIRRILPISLTATKSRASARLSTISVQVPREGVTVVIKCTFLEVFEHGDCCSLLADAADALDGTLKKNGVRTNLLLTEPLINL